MNIIEQYEILVSQNEWEEAIPVIQEIIKRNPEIDTSWFNYGVCLDELGKHSDAADAFIKAHELNITDYGIHYRILRSLRLAKDDSQLYQFIDYLCQNFKDEIKTIFDSEEFYQIQDRNEFIELKSKYYKT